MINTYYHKLLAIGLRSSNCINSVIHLDEFANSTKIKVTMPATQHLIEEL